MKSPDRQEGKVLHCFAQHLLKPLTVGQKKTPPFWVLTANFSTWGCFSFIGLMTSNGKHNSCWSFPGRPWNECLAGWRADTNHEGEQRNPRASHWDMKQENSVHMGLSSGHVSQCPLHTSSPCSDEWAIVHGVTITQLSEMRWATCAIQDLAW